MRKRLQKKLFKGPFERFGFDIKGEFCANIDKDKTMWALYDFLEQYKMSGAIGYRTEKDDFDWYIDVGTRKMNPIEQKKIVVDWLKKRDDLLSFESGKLLDSNNQPFCP